MLSFVFEAHIAKLDVASDTGQIDSVGRILNLWLDVQYIHEALKAGDAFLIQPSKVDEAVNRLDQDGDTHQVGEQIGEIKRGTEHRRAAEDDHSDGDELREGGHA